MAAHYRIDEHLKLVIEGNDLTDQPIVQYTDVHAQRPEAITRSGATYSVGFAYAF
jgi:hypothetical protein